MEPEFSNPLENGFLLSLRPAAPLQPTAVLSWSDTPLTQRLSFVARCATRNALGYRYAAPTGAAFWRGIALRASRLRFRERRGDADENKNRKFPNYNKNPARFSHTHKIAVQPDDWSERPKRLSCSSVADLPENRHQLRICAAAVHSGEACAIHCLRHVIAYL